LINLSCSDKESKLAILEKTICELERTLKENEESQRKFLTETAEIKERIICENNVSSHIIKGTLVILNYLVYSFRNKSKYLQKK
jgi:hypothetical protein